MIAFDDLQQELSEELSRLEALRTKAAAIDEQKAADALARLESMETVDQVRRSVSAAQGDRSVLGEADKKLLVAENLELTESEAKGFWPIYASYQQDLDKINQRMGKLITEYAENYKSMTDEVADKLVTEASAIEADRTALIQSYLPKLKKVLPGKKVARYYQLESKIRALINFELAANIPLVQ